MTPETHTPSEPAGELLLFLIAIAIGGVVVAEAAFVAIGGMVLMVATVFLALAVTGGVIYAVARPSDQKITRRRSFQEATMTNSATQPGPIGFAKMAGSSIAGRDAAPWVTDFLNAAYFRRAATSARSTTCASRSASSRRTGTARTRRRRLRVTDLPAFHRAFGTERFANDGRGSTAKR